MLKDNFGVYETTFTYIEPDNGKFYEFRKYVNSKKIKNLGGIYALYCEEDKQIIFRKSEYLRDRSYKKFSEGKCVDFICCNDEENSIIINTSNKYDSKTLKNYLKWSENSYNLPSYIDRSKLTEEEFQVLRKLIKKSLP